MKKVLKWVFGIFFGLIIIGLIFGDPPKKSGDEQSVDETPAASTAEPPFETTAGEIARAYSENTLAADRKYKGKEFVVSGAVADINTDMFDHAYLMLKGGVNQFMEPHFTLADSEKDKAAELKKGQKVKLKCVGKGDVAKSPMSEDCEILNIDGK